MLLALQQLGLAQETDAAPETEVCRTNNQQPKPGGRETCVNALQVGLAGFGCAAQEAENTKQKCRTKKETSGDGVGKLSRAQRNGNRRRRRCFCWDAGTGVSVETAGVLAWETWERTGAYWRGERGGGGCRYRICVGSIGHRSDRVSRRELGLEADRKCDRCWANSWWMGRNGSNGCRPRSNATTATTSAVRHVDYARRSKDGRRGWSQLGADLGLVHAPLPSHDAADARRGQTVSRGGLMGDLIVEAHGLMIGRRDEGRLPLVSIGVHRPLSSPSSLPPLSSRTFSPATDWLRFCCDWRPPLPLFVWLG